MDRDAQAARSLSDHLAEHPGSAALLELVRAALAAIGPTDEDLTRSQVAFRRRRRIVVRAWVPDQYLGDGHAPLVLTFAFGERDGSPRWKEVVEPTPGRFTHHLELWEPAEVDADVAGWLRRAYDAAG